MNREKDDIKTELMALVAEFAQLLGYIRTQTVRRIWRDNDIDGYPWNEQI